LGFDEFPPVADRKKNQPHEPTLIHGVSLN
jgi:hypothetical protein